MGLLSILRKLKTNPDRELRILLLGLVRCLKNGNTRNLIFSCFTDRGWILAISILSVIYGDNKYLLFNCGQMENYTCF
jgi:hypothetical protein